MTTATFASLGLNSDLLEGIHKLGYEQPSPIQAKTIPVALSGSDIVGLSQTGSGKTAAFGLPALQKIDLSLAETQVLVLCPTRELAVQVCEEIHRLASCVKGLVAVPVYGGAPMHRQVKSLRAGAHLIVGTPGRVIDHLDRGNLRTDAIHTVVLDEADRMLDMGFKDDMERILGSIPGERQTLFFSATMNNAVEKLIRSFSNKPQMLEIEKKSMTVDSIEQFYFEVRSRSKVEVLTRLLDMDPPKRGIVFCNTKQMVDDCCEALLARGYAADRIHGDITQQGRERVIARFRDGSVELLIATDVAARGLDIEHVEAVFNYDLPYDPEDYVHRIGRTGRAGRTGKAYTFVYGREVYRLQAIERFIRTPLKRRPIPSAEEVEGHRSDKVFNAVRERLETGDFTPHDAFTDRLLDQGFTPTDIASVLFTMVRTDEGRSIERIQEDSEPFREQAAQQGGGGKGKKKKFGGKSQSYGQRGQGKFSGESSKEFKPRYEDKGPKKSFDKPFNKPAGSKPKKDKPAWVDKKTAPKRRFKQPD